MAALMPYARQVEKVASCRSRDPYRMMSASFRSGSSRVVGPE